MRHQLVPLLRLRWTMVRSPAARRRVLVAALGLAALCVLAVVVGLLLPGDRTQVLLLAPSVFLGVAVVALLAPLVAGGGNELYPEEQLVAYPVTASTLFAASVCLSPLNLAWTVQLLGVLGVSAYVAGPGTGLLPALVTCLAYVALVTVAGQLLGWVVVGVRQRRRGRAWTGALAVALVASTAVLVVTGSLGYVLDAAPTTWVVIGLVDGATGDLGGWALVTAALTAGTWLVARLGLRACRWSLTRPREAGTRSMGVVRRRPTRPGALAAQLAVDRATVWRTPSLRRGLLVLGLLPGLAAAAAGLDWTTLVLLPGLVAAGAGLLFGVNAFCLGGPGALWLESLPARPAVSLWAKATVTGEVCLAAVLLTVLAGAVRVQDEAPTASEVVALGACAVVTLARVASVCLRLSVTKPHRADLQGPRATPAPPGSMAAYSARLAVSTTFIALLFAASSTAADWRVPAVLALPFVLLSTRHLLRSARLWHEPQVRSRVAHVVALG